MMQSTLTCQKCSQLFRDGGKKEIEVSYLTWWKEVKTKYPVSFKSRRLKIETYSVIQTVKYLVMANQVGNHYLSIRYLLFSLLLGGSCVFK